MSESEQRTILAVGAHPDDMEFGCGGILLKEAAAGSVIHLVVCSKGEAGSNGSSGQRMGEAEAAARQLGASLDFLDMGGDARIEVNRQNAFLLAASLRERRPDVVLAPTTAENQHPDHAAVGKMVRDACRFARYAGLEELKGGAPAHGIGSLLYYSITSQGESDGATRLVVDISMQFDAWIELMQCHESQMKTRNYVDLQVAKARSLGLSSGCDYAQALYSQDGLLFEDLGALKKGARCF